MYKSIQPYIKPVATGVAFTYIMSESVCDVVAVRGQTFQNGSENSIRPAADETSYVFVDKISHKMSAGYRSGDKILMIDPSDPKRKLVRTIATSMNTWGDRVGFGSARVPVPTGYTWVRCLPEGDKAEYDSMDFGVVSLGMLEGHARCVVWPPSRMAIIDRDHRFE